MIHLSTLRMTTRVRNSLLGVALIFLGAATLGIICLDPDGFFTPGIFLPLMIDAALGFCAGWVSNRAAWRFLAWPLLPVSVVCCIIFLTLDERNDHPGHPAGLAGLAYIYLLVAGMAMTGLALILGYYVRLTTTPKQVS